MVTTVFKFGGFDKKMDPIIGGTQETQYTIALVLEIMAFLFIPVMLCVKPCILKTPADQIHEANQIEFAPIPQGDDGPVGQSINQHEQSEERNSSDIIMK